MKTSQEVFNRCTQAFKIFFKKFNFKGCSEKVVKLSKLPTLKSCKARYFSKTP